MSPEEQLLQEFRQTCQARMSDIGLNGREVALLSHIRGLQRTLETVTTFIEEEAAKRYVNNNIEISKTVVNTALGIKM